MKLTPRDANDQKLVIQSPESGKGAEAVFIPRKAADRLRSRLKDKAVKPEQRIFPITYAAARIIVKNVGIELRPHGLRRHAATSASRSGNPIEIVSKAILRYSTVSTTQRYLGKIRD